MNSKYPNYNKIYEDLILYKFPEKAEYFLSEIKEKVFTVLEVIKFNDKLFGELNKESFNENQKHRSYDKKAILSILDYQKKKKLNNTQLANHFRISRNTVAKWKKIY